MARKKEVIPVPATEVAPKAVRLDLSPDLHAELRVEAAKLGKPMAVVVVATWSWRSWQNGGRREGTVDLLRTALDRGHQDRLHNQPPRTNQASSTSL